ncbi:MAG: homoserine kinase [Elusimicrobiota bacterium]
MRPVKAVRIRIPASTSNLGPGFDVLGMALTLYNEITVERSEKLVVDIRGEGSDSLPKDARNLVVRTFRTLLPRPGFRFRMTNRVPLGRGLGSSAAARLGGLLAAAFLGPRRPPPSEIVLRACSLEGHPDNAVPAFFGGLCASRYEKGKLQFVRLRQPKGLSVVACVPDFEVPTEKARAVMPKQVPLRVAVQTTSRLALLLAAFEHRQYDLLRSAMDDVLHQPYRKKLTPGMAAVIRAALSAGAFGAALSGSGPTVLAFAPKDKAGAAARSMERAFQRVRIASKSLRLCVDTDGARVECEA